MKILACNSNRPLAEAMAAYLNVPLTKASVRRFSDMEVFVEIQENVRGEEAYGRGLSAIVLDAGAGPRSRPGGAGVPPCPI